LSPASLVTVAINHVVAVTVAIALVAINHLPPSLPSLLPTKPLLSSLQSTLVANAIARFTPLALFVTHPPLSPSPSPCRPQPFCHMLPLLVDCFVLTFNVGWAVSQQLSQHTMI
jgi:hypothetical protein